MEERRGLKHIRSLHAGSNSEVVVEVEVEVEGDPDSWSYLLALAGSESRKRRLRIEKEVVRHGADVLLERPTREETDQLLLTQTYLEQISQSLRFRPLADALASVVHVHLVPQVARTPARAEEFPDATLRVPISSTSWHVYRNDRATGLYAGSKSSCRALFPSSPA